MPACPHPSKASYRDAATARRELLRILSRAKAWARPAHPVRAYACRCGAWHLTHLAPDSGTPRDAVEARYALAAL